MKKIELRDVKYLLMIDTETIGTINIKDSVLPFEIGVKIYDLNADKVIKEKSFIIRKFFNNKYIMLSCFSASKYPTYINILKEDKRYKLASVKELCDTLKRYIKKYNISFIVAHNAEFDKDAIDRLCRDNNIENPIKNLDTLDTREVSKVITYSSKYTAYCLNNIDILNDMKESKFITNTGRVRTTAEAIYSYIIDNPNYKESHTALEDIDIEIEILKTSYRALGNTMVSLNTAPTWRDYSVVWSREND